MLNHDCHINLDWIAVKVMKPNAKPFIVGTWYRPPGCGIEILNAFVTLLHHLETHDLETNIIGDFNYDISANPQNHETKKILELCNLYQYSQLIQVPTRLTASSSTLIDLFLTNNPCKFSHHGVSHIGISDHSLIYAVRKSFISTGSSTIINSRQLRNFDPTMFRRDLALAPWQSVENITDPNVAWNAWRNMFLNICDLHAPFRRKKVRNSNSPWLTPHLKKLMFERDKAKKLASRAGCSETWMHFKALRNKVNIAIKKAKVEYYNSFFKNNQGNIKNTWKGINTIFGKIPQSTRIHSLKIGDTIYTTPDEISNRLNHHFCSVGPILANEIPPTDSKFTDYILPLPHVFSLTKTSNDIVLKLIQSLPLNKASGLDGISAKLLKEAGPIVSASLTYIINRSLTTGIFSNDWKVARVTPIYKDDIKTNPNNYRPISVLPIVSKFIERIVFNQLYAFLMRHDLLADAQSGFRPCHSTLTALLDITNDWFSNMDNGLLNGVLFLDLKKAFDTVDHEILLNKLNFYGVDSISLKWFQSYLTDRKQRTYVNGSLSDYGSTVCGVPQGSILGPLLFLIYINDLPPSGLSSTPRLYADDTCLTLSSHDPTDLQIKLNSDLNKVQSWLQANKLSLNVKKTKYSIIATQYKVAHLDHQPDVRINGHSVDRVRTHRYLGVEINDTLTWHSQIDQIVKKVSAGLAILKRARALVPRDTFINMYNALVVPYFDYCSPVWGCIGKCQSERLQKLQNRAARIITNSDYMTPSSCLLHDLGWNTLKKKTY